MEVLPPLPRQQRTPAIGKTHLEVTVLVPEAVQLLGSYCNRIRVGCDVLYRTEFMRVHPEGPGSPDVPSTLPCSIDSCNSARRGKLLDLASSEISFHDELRKALSHPRTFPILFWKLVPLCCDARKLLPKLCQERRTFHGSCDLAPQPRGAALRETCTGAETLRKARVHVCQDATDCLTRGLTCRARPEQENRRFHDARRGNVAKSEVRSRSCAEKQNESERTGGFNEDSGRNDRRKSLRDHSRKSLACFAAIGALLRSFLFCFIENRQTNS